MKMKPESTAAVSQARKILIGVAALLLVLNGIGFVWIKEAETTTMARLHHELDSMRKARPQEREDAFQARVNRSREDVQRFVAALPDKVMIAQVAQEILERLAGNELPKVNMSFAPESTEFPGVMKYTTSFSVSGTYPRLKSFLAEVQNSRTLFCVEGLAFTNQSVDREIVTLSLKIALILRSGVEETPQRQGL